MSSSMYSLPPSVPWHEEQGAVDQLVKLSDPASQVDILAQLFSDESRLNYFNLSHCVTLLPVVRNLLQSEFSELRDSFLLPAVVLRTVIVVELLVSLGVVFMVVGCLLCVTGTFSQP